jgi:hypothetical protein
LGLDRTALVGSLPHAQLVDAPLLVLGNPGDSEISMWRASCGWSKSMRSCCAPGSFFGSR